MLPYSQNPAWADVTPIAIDDLGPAPFAPILLSEEYKDAMSYFHAVSQSGELSHRVLQLTSHLVTLNSALYSVWYTRQLVLVELQCNLDDEISMLNEMLLDSPKSYQLWHHRQFVMDRLRNPGSSELAFILQMAEDDAKNYHMWNYRQWLVTSFQLWDGELEFVNRLIDDDVRNNSAWVYRFFLLFGSSNDRVVDLDMDKEVQYVVSAIRIAPSNESPWVYLRGILRYQNLKAPDIVMDLCKSLAEGQCLSAYLFGFLADEYAQLGDTDAAIQTCIHLEEVIDKTRSRYWAYRRQQLQSKPPTST